MNYCRMCKKDKLEKFLDLGFTPPADSFLRKEQLREPETHYPLEVMVCKHCGLSQLSYVVSPEILYRYDYPYEASITSTGHQHWAEFASSVTHRLELGQDDLVVDVGSNVGVLLEAFRQNGTRILGVDPASNIVRIAEKRGVETIDEFFNVDTAANILKGKGQASVITATNVFAHIDDLDNFMEAVGLLLKESGTLIIEAPYFLNLIKYLEYDTIYHEHFSYLSLFTVQLIFHKHGLEIFGVEELATHGGSLRIFAKHAEDETKTVSPGVSTLLEKETAKGMNGIAYYTGFQDRADKVKDDLLKFLIEQKQNGRNVAAYGAAAKGNTLLNYCGIRKDLLEFVVDASPYKQGKYLPGSHIPVVSEKEIKKSKPDFVIILPWNIQEEIIAQLEYIRAWRGKFAVPIPHIKII